MIGEELRTKLYQRMNAEQKRYRNSRPDMTYSNVSENKQ